MKIVKLKSLEALEDSHHYSPTEHLKFMDKKLYQLWTSCIVEEDDVWVMVEGQK